MTRCTCPPACETCGNGPHDCACIATPAPVQSSRVEAMRCALAERDAPVMLALADLSAALGSPTVMGTADTGGLEGALIRYAADRIRNAYTPNGLLRSETTQPSPGGEGADAMHKAASDTAPDTGHVKGTGEVVGWRRRHVCYSGVDGRTDGERILTEAKVYADDEPLVLASALAQAQAERDSLVREIDACLRTIPDAVRVREGGNEETIAASLAVSVAKLRAKLFDADAALAQARAECERLRGELGSRDYAGDAAIARCDQLEAELRKARAGKA